MTTKTQDKKARAAKSPAKKAPAAKAKGKEKLSIGFLRASEKAHIAVTDIPLTFFEDLGMFPERIPSVRKFNRQFIGGMYKNVDSMTAKINNAMGAPGRMVRGMVDKLTDATKASGKPVVRPAKGKPGQKKAAIKAKGKAAAPKAKSKAKAVAAKPKAGKKASSGAKSAKKAVEATPVRPINAGVH